jgi:hypothetical protein
MGAIAAGRLLKRSWQNWNQWSITCVGYGRRAPSCISLLRVGPAMSSGVVPGARTQFAYRFLDRHEHAVRANRFDQARAVDLRLRPLIREPGKRADNVRRPKFGDGLSVRSAIQCSRYR